MIEVTALPPITNRHPAPSDGYSMANSTNSGRGPLAACDEQTQNNTGDLRRQGTPHTKLMRSLVYEASGSSPGWKRQHHGTGKKFIAGSLMAHAQHPGIPEDSQTDLSS